MGRPMAVPRVSSPHGFSPLGARGGVTRAEGSGDGWVEDEGDVRSLEVDNRGGVARTLSWTDAPRTARDGGSVYFLPMRRSTRPPLAM